MLTTAVVALAEGVEAPNGFPLRLARYLSDRKHNCTLIWVFRDYAPSASQPFVPGLEIIYFRYFRGAIQRVPETRVERLAEQLAPVLRRFDIVYGFLPSHLTIHAIRERRFSRSRMPIFVTIASYVPERSEDFGDRYQALHSDYFICLGPRPELFSNRNWKLPPAQRIRSMGYHHGGWLRLHRELIELARQYAATPKPMPRAASPAATLCIRHLNRLESLEATLDSIAHQKSNDFTVWVFDYSLAPASAIESLARLEQHYSTRGWRFFRRDNNRFDRRQEPAVSEVESDYLLFMDTDDIASPRLVGRMLEGALLSSDDLLSSWSGRISTGAAYDFEGRMIGTPDVLYKPNGDKPNDPSDRSCVLIKTEVFRTIGSSPNCFDIRFEPGELRIRMSELGYTADVIPEVLIIHRDLSTNSNARD